MKYYNRQLFFLNKIAYNILRRIFSNETRQLYSHNSYHNVFMIRCEKLKCTKKTLSRTVSYKST